MGPIRAPLSVCILGDGCGGAGEADKDCGGAIESATGRSDASSLSPCQVQGNATPGAA